MLVWETKITLVTGHKLLHAILGKKVGLPALVAARLQGWSHLQLTHMTSTIVLPRKWEKHVPYPVCL